MQGEWRKQEAACVHSLLKIRRCRARVNFCLQNIGFKRVGSVRLFFCAISRVRKRQGQDVCLHTRLSMTIYDEQREREMRSISSLLIHTTSRLFAQKAGAPYACLYFSYSFFSRSYSLLIRWMISVSPARLSGWKIFVRSLYRFLSVRIFFTPLKKMLVSV